jgi:SAM-dependent MidA family methyltransferase
MKPTPTDHHTVLPAPDPIAAVHSHRLLQHLRSEMIAAGGSIPFLRFMDLALYAPGLGYYRAGARKFGPDGDFITAPELSPLFSHCLARQCQQILVQTGGGAILELGAGTGTMACDLLLELERLNSLPKRYAILELSGELRERQHQTLSRRIPHLLGQIVWLDTLPDSGWRGVILGNEVLDALPVERFRMTGAGPRRMEVIWHGDDLPEALLETFPETAQGNLAWAEGAPDPALTETVAQIEAQIGWGLPEGYVSEYVPQLGSWLSTVAESLTAGALLLIDYGYSRREYYHPERTDGTLLCHYRHRVHDNPLILPGLQDITASVDFTAVAAAGRAAGLALAGYTSQNYFLFGCGLMEELAQMDTTDTVRYLEQVRQVKLLTLPGEMGERFKAIALTRDIDGPLCGFSFRDQRDRL